MYDAIIVGARCAGSPTAMLLARKGYKVLLLDKATFPSDTISTHIVLIPGTVRLKRWGLLDKIYASGSRAIKTLVMDNGFFALEGTPPPFEGTSDIVTPRRIVLDKILVDAAVEAGAELREGCSVEEVIMDGDRVIGVRCHTKGGPTVVEKARIVIGADGRNSLVARAVKATEYNTKPAQTAWYYTYWSNVPIDALSFYLAPNRAIGFIPTDNGQVCIPIIWPHSEFHAYRSDIEGNYMKTFELVPKLAEMMRDATREERFVGMSELPGFYKKSYGPGWALVGDAGYHRDPMTGQGISDAMTGAEVLAEALDAGFSGREELDIALQRNEQHRDISTAPMYEMTAEWASLQPPPQEMQQLMLALRDNQEQTDRFMGTISGSIPIPEFFSPENIGRIMQRVEVPEV